MTSEEKSIIKQIKEEIVVMRLQMRILTEAEFKKKIDKVGKLIDELLIDNVDNKSVKV